MKQGGIHLGGCCLQKRIQGNYQEGLASVAPKQAKGSEPTAMIDTAASVRLRNHRF